MKMKQWICDKLFDLLTWLSKTEQPTLEELRASAREEVQRLQAPQVWFDPTVRSYPQPQKIVNPRGSYFKARHLEFMPPVIRTNTEPIDLEKDFPKWLTDAPIAVKDMTPAQIERVPTIRDLTEGWDKDKTEERTAIDKLLYQGRQERQARQAG